MNELTKKSLKVGGILCAIGGIAALLIGGVYALAEPKIVENEANATKTAQQAVYPSANYFEGNDLSSASVETISDSWKAYDSDSKATLYGSLYKGKKKNSYGEVALMVGVSAKGLDKIAIISDTESYGKTMEKSYLAGLNNGSISVDKDPADLKTGATFACKLVYSIVHEALALYQEGK
jgi:Na+-translocating ferredoxin:NAD+ oxidoreductase RnfG subunit